MMGLFGRIWDAEVRRTEAQAARSVASGIKGAIYDVTGGILGAPDHGSRGFQAPPRPTGYERPMGPYAQDGGYGGGRGGYGGGYGGGGYGRGAPQQEQSGGIAGFFKSIGNGISNAFRSLTDFVGITEPESRVAYNNTPQRRPDQGQSRQDAEAYRRGAPTQDVANVREMNASPLMEKSGIKTNVNLHEDFDVAASGTRVAAAPQVGPTTVYAVDTAPARQQTQPNAFGGGMS